MKSQWMIYDANGYSARLAIEKALKLGKAPILAGRNQTAIAALGKKFDLPVRVFDLSTTDKVAGQLADDTGGMNRSQQCCN
jgi:short subunit dehydrogenase-like uncharacterized protein